MNKELIERLIKFISDVQPGCAAGESEKDSIINALQKAKDEQGDNTAKFHFEGSYDPDNIEKYSKEKSKELKDKMETLKSNTTN
tara:strand:- start:500 stop:751 length:252 start_codon:yes stop_codon:yes gene_type:complete